MGSVLRSSSVPANKNPCAQDFKLLYLYFIPKVTLCTSVASVAPEALEFRVRL